LDPTFDTGAGVAGGSLSTLAIQPDDKVLIGGAFIGYDGVVRNNIARVYGDFTNGLDDSAVATSGIQLYPNPANSWVVVERGEWNGPARFQLLDVSGRSLLSQTGNGPTVTLDLSGIAPGSYLLVVDDGATRHTRSVVITR
jgi:hypothetical protein